MTGGLGDYAVVGGILLGTLVLAAGMLGINAFMRPKAPASEKYLTYESGVDPVGSGWAQSTIHYFVYAFLYVIFAVDAVFLFPWAVVLKSLGVAGAIEMGIFLGIVLLGLVYAWRKGVLSWTR
jgi:NADH-quinone oxidoreductase subunit A